MHTRLSSAAGLLFGLAPGLLSATSVTTPPAEYFDPPAEGSSYTDGYRVVGSLTPASWSWGKIELLEGFQKYRTEGYNLRTAKLRAQDTWQSKEYPLATYFGELNQELVQGFNLYYRNSCVSSTTATCPDPGPTRPEARFALLHHGPNTAKNACDKTKTPVLLVHGAMQNANTWLYPGGNDGNGNPYPGTPQLEGFVQALERENMCTYAITYGNFHGDNFSQAINLANAIARVKTLTGRSKVNVVAWSKGVLSADLYLANVANWDDWGPRYFEQIAALQADAVPLYRKDIGTYVALSGPHKGIDLNWRHPYNNLLITSTDESAPVGMGPVTWSWMMAAQCVTWGYYSSPDSPWWPNPYAYSVCENRGATWPDFWKKIYMSNITGLDAEGRPVYSNSLKQLNVRQGVSRSSFNFDMYNLAMWGSVDENGRFKSAYLGQLQATYDLRDYYDTPVRLDDGYDWSALDTDEYNWYQWLILKLGYNPTSLTQDAGWLLDEDHIECRNTAFEPSLYPCKAVHSQIDRRAAESVQNGKATYKLFDSIGIDAAMEMGGNLIDRLQRHGLSQDLSMLYVLHGTSLGPAGTNFEIDGMMSPTDDPNGDAVLFDVSVAARDQLTLGWTSTNKSSRSKQEGIALSHLEVGVAPAAWAKMIAQFKASEGL